MPSIELLVTPQIDPPFLLRIPCAQPEWGHIEVRLSAVQVAELTQKCTSALTFWIESAMRGFQVKDSLIEELRRTGRWPQEPG